MRKKFCWIAMLVLIVAMMGILVACSASKTPKGRKFLNSYKYILDGEKYEVEEGQKSFFKKVTYTIDSIAYIDEENGRATVTVTAPDMQAIFEAAAEEEVSEGLATVEESEQDIDMDGDGHISFDEDFAALQRPLKEKERRQISTELTLEKIEKKLKGDCKMISSTFDMELKKVGSTWKLVPNNNWNTAISGNLGGILQDYFNRAMGGQE